MVLRLPIPPSVNALYANVRHVGRVKTRAYRDWLLQADGYYLMQKRGLTPLEGKYSFIMRVPANMRGDVDGRLKAILDFLVSRNLTSDDSQCWSSKVERDESIEKGFCEIEVRVA